jgi:hypothetical protein
MGIEVRALRRLMAELGLDRLDGMTAGGGLAGYRVAAADLPTPFATSPKGGLSETR